MELVHRALSTQFHLYLLGTHNAKMVCVNPKPIEFAKLKLVIHGVNNKKFLLNQIPKKSFFAGMLRNR